MPGYSPLLYVSTAHFHNYGGGSLAPYASPAAAASFSSSLLSGRKPPPPPLSAHPHHYHHEMLLCPHGGHKTPTPTPIGTDDHVDQPSVGSVVGATTGASSHHHLCTLAGAATCGYSSSPRSSTFLSCLNITVVYRIVVMYLTGSEVDLVVLCLPPTSPLRRRVLQDRAVWWSLLRRDFYLLAAFNEAEDQQQQQQQKETCSDGHDCDERVSESNRNQLSLGGLHHTLSQQRFDPTAAVKGSPHSVLEAMVAHGAPLESSSDVCGGFTAASTSSGATVTATLLWPPPNANGDANSECGGVVGAEMTPPTSAAAAAAPEVQDAASENDKNISELEVAQNSSRSSRPQKEENDGNDQDEDHHKCSCFCVYFRCTAKEETAVPMEAIDAESKEGAKDLHHQNHKEQNDDDDDENNQNEFRYLYYALHVDRLLHTVAPDSPSGIRHRVLASYPVPSWQPSGPAAKESGTGRRFREFVLDRLPQYLSGGGGQATPASPWKKEGPTRWWSPWVIGRCCAVCFWVFRRFVFSIVVGQRPERQQSESSISATGNQATGYVGMYRSVIDVLHRVRTRYPLEDAPLSRFVLSRSWTTVNGLADLDGMGRGGSWWVMKRVAWVSMVVMVLLWCSYIALGTLGASLHGVGGAVMQAAINGTVSGGSHHQVNITMSQHPAPAAAAAATSTEAVMDSGNNGGNNECKETNIETIFWMLWYCVSTVGGTVHRAAVHVMSWAAGCISVPTQQQRGGSVPTVPGHHHHQHHHHDHPAPGHTTTTTTTVTVPVVYPRLHWVALCDAIVHLYCRFVGDKSFMAPVLEFFSQFRSCSLISGYWTTAASSFPSLATIIAGALNCSIQVYFSSSLPTPSSVAVATNSRLLNHTSSVAVLGTTNVSIGNASTAETTAVSHQLGLTTHNHSSHGRNNTKSSIQRNDSRSGNISVTGLTTTTAVKTPSQSPSSSQDQREWVWVAAMVVGGALCRLLHREIAFRRRRRDVLGASMDGPEDDDFMPSSSSASVHLIRTAANTSLGSWMAASSAAAGVGGSPTTTTTTMSCVSFVHPKNTADIIPGSRDKFTSSSSSMATAASLAASITVGEVDERGGSHHRPYRRLLSSLPSVDVTSCYCFYLRSFAPMMPHPLTACIATANVMLTRTVITMAALTAAPFFYFIVSLAVVPTGHLLCLLLCVFILFSPFQGGFVRVRLAILAVIMCLFDIVDVVAVGWLPVTKSLAAFGRFMFTSLLWVLDPPTVVQVGRGAYPSPPPPPAAPAPVLSGRRPGPSSTTPAAATLGWVDIVKEVVQRGWYAAAPPGSAAVNSVEDCRVVGLLVVWGVVTVAYMRWYAPAVAATMEEAASPHDATDWASPVYHHPLRYNPDDVEIRRRDACRGLSGPGGSVVMVVTTAAADTSSSSLAPSETTEKEPDDDDDTASEYREGCSTAPSWRGEAETEGGVPLLPPVSLGQRVKRWLRAQWYEVLDGTDALLAVVAAEEWIFLLSLVPIMFELTSTPSTAAPTSPAVPAASVIALRWKESLSLQHGMAVVIIMTAAQEVLGLVLFWFRCRYWGGHTDDHNPHHNIHHQHDHHQRIVSHPFTCIRVPARREVSMLLKSAP